MSEQRVITSTDYLEKGSKVYMAESVRGYYSLSEADVGGSRKSRKTGEITSVSLLNIGTRKYASLGGHFPYPLRTSLGLEEDAIVGSIMDHQLGQIYFIFAPFDPAVADEFNRIQDQHRGAFEAEEGRKFAAAAQAEAKRLEEARDWVNSMEVIEAGPLTVFVGETDSFVVGPTTEVPGYDWETSQTVVNYSVSIAVWTTQGGLGSTHVTGLTNDLAELLVKHIAST